MSKYLDTFLENAALRAENKTLRAVIFDLYCEVGGSPTQFSTWLSSCTPTTPPPTSPSAT